MLQALVGGAGRLAGMVLVLLVGLSTAWAQEGPAAVASDPSSLPPPAMPAAPWMFPAEPAMLEYVLRPGTESCRDEEHFRLELAIHRDARRDGEFLPFDLYDDERVLVRITVEKTAAGKFRGVVEHVPPPGQAKAPPVERVNSECRDLIRDVAFVASVYLPFLQRPACVPLEVPAPATVPPPAPVSAAQLRPGPVLAVVVAPGQAERPSPDEQDCDPAKEGDAANDAACERLLARLQTKYGRRVEFWLLGGGLMTLAYTSGPGGGFAVGGAAQGKHWSVGLEAQVTLPAYATTGAPDEDFDVSSFVGLVVPCARFGETVRFLGCGVLGGGAQLARDTQAPSDKDAWGPAVRLGPRLGLEVPLGNRFAIQAYGEVSFAPVPFRITYKGAGEPDRRWTQSPASVFLGAMFSVKLTD